MLGAPEEPVNALTGYYALRGKCYTSLGPTEPPFNPVAEREGAVTL